MASALESPGVWRPSCFNCRRSKRRCDKIVPVCNLCRRRGIECQYPRHRGQTSALPTENNSTPEEVETAVRSPSTIPVAGTSSATSLSNDARSGQTATLPTSAVATTTIIRFLAPDLFRKLRLQSPLLTWDIPSDVALHLGDRQSMQDVTSAFIRLTESWMPIVNVKRHLASVLNPLLAPLRRPTALLALCMKLCSLSVNDETGSESRRSLYLLVKRFYAEVERLDEPCLEVMQAGVFITIFEIGDAIYPAAYLTVGALARHGLAMGLNKINHDRMGQGVAGAADAAASWIDVEEMRRVWWAVLILDRFLNFSHPSRSLSTTDPNFEDYLPVDDERFFDASTEPEDAIPISQAFNLRLGMFARLCQATYLISKVLAIFRQACDDCDDSGLPFDKPQLCRTLEALARANELEVTIRKLAFCSQSVVAYNGVLLLQQHRWEQAGPILTYDPQDHTFPETQSALETLHNISTALRQGDYDDQKYLDRGECTIFLVDLVYRGILSLMTTGQGRPSTEVRERIESLRWLLRRTRGRWPLAGLYESILEAKESILAVAAL